MTTVPPTARERELTRPSPRYPIEVTAGSPELSAREEEEATGRTGALRGPPQPPLPTNVATVRTNATLRERAVDEEGVFTAVPRARCGSSRLKGSR